MRCLIKLVRATHHDKGGDSTKPTTNTLAELSMAVFVCPGFTDMQKAAVADLLRSSGFGKLTEDKALNLRFGGVDKFAAHMPFLALVKKPGVDDGIV
ncbi:MAG: hypothetical protein INR62_08665, partial [Rhodospirillales bacterium]|nr:hypothetical protein [Acetobacter sp.]